jgi:acetyltransferase-like isoleucine patch superfamily enzyme
MKVTKKEFENFNIESWSDRNFFPHQDVKLARFCSIKNTEINYSVTIDAFSYMVSGYIAFCEVGRYCSFGEDVQIGRQAHALNNWSSSPFFTGQGLGANNTITSVKTLSKLKAAYGNGKPKRTIIGNDVWIGHGAFIKPGIQIGDGSVIAAASVITKDVEPYSIMGGNPAKLIKKRFDSMTIDKLTSSRWHRYPPNVLLNLKTSDLNQFILDLEKNKKNLKEYESEYLYINNVKQDFI